MLWSPVVAVLMVVVTGAVLIAARHMYGPHYLERGALRASGESGLLPSAIAIALLALLSRGLHLDGLTDTVDGLASHQPPDRALAIMREGSVGALGVASLILLLLLDVFALSVGVRDHHGTQSLAVSVITGRLAMLWACTPGVKPARTTGMGALVAGTVSRRAAAAWTAIVLAGAILYGRFDTEAGSARGAVRAGVAVIVALAVAWAVQKHAVRRFGGITGDILGALCEIATLAALLTLAVARTL